MDCSKSSAGATTFNFVIAFNTIKSLFIQHKDTGASQSSGKWYVYDTRLTTSKYSTKSISLIGIGWYESGAGTYTPVNALVTVIGD